MSLVIAPPATAEVVLPESIGGENVAVLCRSSCCACYFSPLAACCLMSYVLSWSLIILLVPSPCEGEPASPRYRILMLIPRSSQNTRTFATLCSSSKSSFIRSLLPSLMSPFSPLSLVLCSFVFVQQPCRPPQSMATAPISYLASADLSKSCHLPHSATLRLSWITTEM